MHDGFPNTVTLFWTTRKWPTQATILHTAQAPGFLCPGTRPARGKRNGAFNVSVFTLSFVCSGRVPVEEKHHCPGPRSYGHH
jgi:hypothetical protein